MAGKISVERWQRIDSIFQAAVELHGHERIVYLDEVCGDDNEVRQIVETMLAADGRGSQIDKSALEVAAVLFVDNRSQLAPGQTFGHYEIDRMIGKGGMGEVYLAADKMLNRKIALKLLPVDYTKDQDRLRRFQQEARAASALNHPNILTIYELREIDERQYIATEYVEGETLRQRLERGPLPLSEVLDVALQITSALAAAHRAGIVHRDLKPENIMLRPDGFVKVLDFGLAKLTEQLEQSSSAHSYDGPDISSGLVMGTVRYMSPEQARGLSVDARSDLFSLGVVLYETIAGRPPFEGKTTNEVVAAILKSQPKALANAPAGLSVLINKALQKDKSTRYQSADELAADLKRLREKAEIPGNLDQHLRHITERSGAVGKSNPTWQRHMTQPRETATSIEYLTATVNRFPVLSIVTLAVFAIVSVAVGVAVYKKAPTGPAQKVVQTPKITRLTSSGNAMRPAISPDGKFVFYGKDENEKTSLWLREIETNREVELVPPTEDTFGGASFSPDGTLVYYAMGTTQQLLRLHLGWNVYRMRVSGGTTSKILSGVAGRVSVSPDGNRLAYVRVGLSDEEIALATADADGNDERLVLKRKPPDGLDSDVSWNPAGTSLTYVVYSGIGNEALKRRLMEVNLADATERSISDEQWEKIYEMVWLPDATGLLVTANDSLNRRQIWHVSYPSGEARRLTNDPASYYSLSISLDGTAVVSEENEGQYRIWLATANSNDSFRPDLISARQVSDRRFDGSPSLAFAPNGKIVFSASETGTPGIWVMDVDGNNRKQLTPVGSWFAVTPDGQYIVFTFSQGDKDTAHIFRMDLDGRNLKQLTAGSLENRPSVSPDSRWVIYSSYESREPTTWKVSIDGGEPIQLTTTQSYNPVYSPDGNLIAYGFWTDKKEPRLAIIPSHGGEPVRTIDLPSGFLTFSWVPDGKGLSMIFSEHNGSGNLWYQPIDGGPARQLTNFTDDKLVNAAWSADGTKLAFVRHSEVSDIVLMNDLK